MIPMLAMLSSVVALSCAFASFVRLCFTLSPTRLDPRILRSALLGDDPESARRDLQKAMASLPELAWEHDLFAASDECRAEARSARINEQLTELDGLSSRWARVPRVCASVATSTGFLLASVWLLQTKASPGVESADGVLVMLAPALDVLAVGIAGAALCAAVHVRCRTLRKQHVRGVDRLVETLEAMVATRSLTGAPKPVA